MIIEIAEFTIVEGREAAFEQTMLVARRIIARSPGFISIEFGRGVERPSVYQLRVCWHTVENHMKDFRESDLYAEWSSLVGPFFAGPAKVEHFEAKMDPFRG